MGYIDQAVQYGYEAKEILDRLLSDNPEFSKRAGKAIAAGYSAEQILRFLANSFKGKGGTSAAKALGMRPQYARNLAFSEELDPATVIPEAQRSDPRAFRTGVAGLTGAGIVASIGGLVGGPSGAIKGAQIGAFSLSDLLSSYEKKVQEGETLSFSDFVKSAVKGSLTPEVSNQLLSLGQSLYGQSDAVRQPSEEAQEAPAQVPVGSEKAAVKSDAIREMSSDEAANILKQAGQFERAATIAKNNPDDVVARAMELTTNKNFNKEIQKQYGKGIAEITLTAMPLLREGGAETQETVQVEKTQPAGSYEGMEEAVESEALQEMQQPSKTDVKRLDMERDPIGQAYQSLIQIPEATQKLGKIAPFASALKSSNVRGATYDADTQKMRVVFAPKAGRKGGTVYEYDGIDLETFKSMTGGEAKPLTEGESEFGIWFNEKNPSVGAAFHKFIKTNPDKFPYQKQEPSGYRVDEKQLIEADRTFLGASLFEPFKTARERGKQLQKGSALRQLEPALKSMDDEFVADIVQFLEEKLKSKLKTPPKVSRLQKEFRKEFL